MEPTLCREGKHGVPGARPAPRLQAVGLCLFFWPFLFFSFLFGLIVLIKSFCPVLLLAGPTMPRAAQRRFLCSCPSAGPRGAGLPVCAVVMATRAAGAPRAAEGLTRLTSLREQARGRGPAGAARGPGGQRPGRRIAER